MKTETQVIGTFMGHADRNNALTEIVKIQASQLYEEEDIFKEETLALFLVDHVFGVYLLCLFGKTALGLEHFCECSALIQD